MKPDFVPDDEEGFAAASKDLVARFEATPAGRDRGWVIQSVLRFKWAYLGGDLGAWTVEDLEEVLLGLFPAKVMIDEQDLDVIPAATAAFLRHLGDEGVLEEAERLALHVDRMAPVFRIEASNPANWSFGKRLWGQAAGEGVDLSDATSMQRFMDDFNQRPFAERDAILGPSLAAMGRSVPPLPPTALAPEAELEAAAEQAPTVRRLRELVAYVGDGRPVTEKGNLKLADAKELVDRLGTGDRVDEVIGDHTFRTRSLDELPGLHLLYALALETGFLEVRGRKVVRGPAVDTLEDARETAFIAAFTLLDGIGPAQHHYGDDPYGMGWFAEELDAELTPILLELYRDGRAEITALADDLWEWLLDAFAFDDVDPAKLELHRETMEWTLRKCLDRLADLGVVAVEGEVVTEERKVTHRRGGTVGLTPLGTWVVNRMASMVTDAPVVGGLREASAADLLAVVADVAADEATAELSAWVQHRGPEVAAEELVAALPGAGVTARGLAFRALLDLGEAAAPAVERLADDDEAWPYALVWRVDSRRAAPDEVACGGDAERFVALLGAVVDLWGGEAAVAGWAGPAAEPTGLATMLESAWRVKRPETELVLAAIGDLHPDKVTAKAARKALFKHRSSAT